MLYKLNVLGPTIYPAVFSQDAIHCCDNLVPWVQERQVPVFFARTDGAGTLLSQLSSDAGWEALGRWGGCQKYGLERVGMLFWEVKSALIVLKQVGSQIWNLSLD